MKVVVKVDPRRAKAPARHVSSVLRRSGEACRVEEVFPGLKTGASAGLVTIHLPDAGDAKVRRATLKALREDDAIAYVDMPKTRRPT